MKQNKAKANRMLKMYFSSIYYAWVLMATCFLKITPYIWFTSFHIVMYDWLFFFIEIAFSIHVHFVLYNLFLLLGLNTLRIILKKSNPSLSYILQIFLLNVAVCFLTCILFFIYIQKFKYLCSQIYQKFSLCLLNFMSSWTWFFILQTFIHSLWSFTTYFLLK